MPVNQHSSGMKCHSSRIDASLCSVFAAVSLPNGGATRCQTMQRMSSAMRLWRGLTRMTFGSGHHGQRIIESSSPRPAAISGSSSVLITTRLEDLSAHSSSHAARSSIVAVVSGWALSYVRKTSENDMISS